MHREFCIPASLAHLKWMYVFPLISLFNIITTHQDAANPPSFPLWFQHLHLSVHLQYSWITFVCLFFRAAPKACGSSRARGQTGAAAASPHHSHSNTSAKQHLQLTPQLTAMPSSSSAEQGQGSNPNPHGSWLGLLPLSRSSGWFYQGCNFPCSRLIFLLTSQFTFPVVPWVSSKDVLRVLKVPFETKVILFTTSGSLQHQPPPIHYLSDSKNCLVVGVGLSVYSLSSFTSPDSKDHKIMLIPSPRCPKYITAFIFIPPNSSSCHCFCLASLSFQFSAHIPTELSS